MKLWVRLQSDEGSGVTGAIITLILYIASTTVSSLMLYEYLIHIHQNGRYAPYAYIMGLGCSL
jgi:hypothetical protein